MSFCANTTLGSISICPVCGGALFLYKYTRDMSDSVYYSHRDYEYEYRCRSGCEVSCRSPVWLYSHKKDHVDLDIASLNASIKKFEEMLMHKYGELAVKITAGNAGVTWGRQDDYLVCEPELRVITADWTKGIPLSAKSLSLSTKLGAVALFPRLLKELEELNKVSRGNVKSAVLTINSLLVKNS